MLDFEVTPETTSSKYLIAHTKVRVEAVLIKLKIKRPALIELLIEKYPELKEKRPSVHQAVFGFQGMPYVYEKLPELLNN